MSSKLNYTDPLTCLYTWIIRFANACLLFSNFRQNLKDFSFSEYEYVFSKRGNPLLLLAGYTFYRQTVYRNSKVRWLCATHHCKGCTATVHTYKETLLSVRNHHNHLPRKNWCNAKQKPVKSYNFVWMIDFFLFRLSYRILVFKPSGSSVTFVRFRCTVQVVSPAFTSVLHLIFYPIRLICTECTW